MSIKKQRSLRLESLETRKLMAVDAFDPTGDALIEFDDVTGTLYICGNNGNDSVNVVLEDDDVRVRIDYDDLDDPGDRDHDTQREDIEDVQQIVFRGFEGNDEVSVEVGDLDSGVDIGHISLVFDGDGGNDSFENATPLRSVARGGDDDDTLIGGSNRDVLIGGAGDDTLLGNAGIDRLQGDQGDDSLDGGTGSDTYQFEGSNLGSDTIGETAGQGTDTIDLRDLELTNNSANDYTYLDLSRTNTQYVYYAQNGEHLMLTLSDGEAIENIRGTEAADYYFGNENSNRLYGYGGDDYMIGDEGNDYLYGYAGNDYLHGHRGSDRLYGGSGHDLLMGDELSNVVDQAWWDLTSDDTHAAGDVVSALRQRASDNGNLDGFMAWVEQDESDYDAVDYLYGDGGNDLLYGGSGNDHMRGYAGDDVLLGGGGADWLHGDSSFERSTDGHDQLFGGSGADQMFGRGGNDTLMGGGAADTLSGGSDNDYMVGGLDGAVDTLNGGAGNDGFMRYYQAGYVTIRGRTFYTWVNAEPENEEDRESGDWTAYYYL